jgi:hypothetical protein
LVIAISSYYGQIRTMVNLLHRHGAVAQTAKKALAAAATNHTTNKGGNNTFDKSFAVKKRQRFDKTPYQKDNRRNDMADNPSTRHSLFSPARDTNSTSPSRAPCIGCRDMRHSKE